MKYVITGGAGHIAKPLTETLLAAGHQVTVIGRNAENLKELVSKGATAAIGSIEDVAFLTSTFEGANAVFTMIPPHFATNDMKGSIEQSGKSYTAALKASKVPYVVNLSSIGAHLPDGVGPVSGIHRVEVAMAALTDTHIVHLRPAYFYYNLFANLGLIKQIGIMGSNFALPAGKFPIVDPTDIAAVAAEELQALNFKGHSVRYVASDETGTDEVASLIGQAIGKPTLQWTKFPDDQAKAGMLQAGLNENVSDNYVEMGNALDTGIMSEDYWKHKPSLGKVKIEDFAKTFAQAYTA